MAWTYSLFILDILGHLPRIYFPSSFDDFSSFRSYCQCHLLGDSSPEHFSEAVLSHHYQSLISVFFSELLVQSAIDSPGRLEAKWGQASFLCPSTWNMSGVYSMCSTISGMNEWNEWICVRYMPCVRHIKCYFSVPLRDEMANIHWIIEKAREFQKNISICFIDYTKAFDCVDHNKVWKILKMMGIPDHLTCLLGNLYAGQEATVRTRHGTTNQFKIWKVVCQGCILSPCLFNLYAGNIMQNVMLDEVQAGIKIAGRNINNLRYADEVMAEREEELKSLLRKVKKEWKSWLKTQHWKN